MLILQYGYKTVGKPTEVKCRVGAAISGDKENKYQKENHQLNQHKKHCKKQFKQKFKQQVLLEEHKIMVVNVNLLVTKYYNNHMTRMNILRWLDAIFARERIVRAYSVSVGTSCQRLEVFGYVQSAIERETTTVCLIFHIGSQLKLRPKNEKKRNFSSQKEMWKKFTFNMLNRSRPFTEGNLEGSFNSTRHGMLISKGWLT